MRSQTDRRRGSGLIVSLSVLAMLAIMATSFITLTRLDVRITTNYVDDLRCEMLAKGTLNYFKALLREDLDRTWGKYENRDTAVGAVGWQWSSTGGRIGTNIPGKRTYKYGTALCNDFWFNPPYRAWTDWGNVFADTVGNQQTFVGHTGYSKCVVGLYRFTDGGSTVDAPTWIARTLSAWRNDGSGTIVHVDHPEAGAEIDFNGDGVTRGGQPYLYNPDTGSYSISNSAFWNEEGSATNYYFNTAPFILFSGDSFYFPGRQLTGEGALPGNLWWRWGAKLGIAHGTYMNLNTAGNLDGADANYLDHMGGLNLLAARSEDEAENYEHKDVRPMAWWDTSPADPRDYRWRSYAGPLLRTDHLGRIKWRGYSGEFELVNSGGFPSFYNEVAFHPSQISLEKLVHHGTFPKRYSSSTEGNSDGVDYVTVGTKREELGIDRSKARSVIAHRLGPDGRVATGHDRYRTGWRRDGATYYKFASPDAPLGDDRVFGANEVMEHDHSSNHPGTSALASFFTVGEWRKLKPYVTMWSTDTILRGKIYPSEGPPYASPGDWRHFNILKRVNINLIGATGPEGLPGEDRALKVKWANLAASERTRLYYMLMAGMRWSNIPATEGERRQQACQFIASLKDMVDRDKNESYYVAPDTSGTWALGNERHPVINEVVLYIVKGNSADWEPYSLHFELYNPMENIPWIPDADEVLDIREYRFKLNDRVFRLGDLMHVNIDDFNADSGRTVTTIGASGMWGKRRSDLNDTMSTAVPFEKNATWDRFVVVRGTTTVPFTATQDEIKAGLTMSLWKPLDDPDAQTCVPTSPGKVETFGGKKYICVDYTPRMMLIPPLGYNAGPGGTYSPYTGIYRRFDPLNAKLHGTPYLPGGSDRDTTVRNKENTTVIWYRGWYPVRGGSLGRPNTDYPDLATKVNYGTWNATKICSPWRYRRHFERNYKIVDGDLPSIGYLGELIMRNCAQDGPITWLHSAGQPPLNTGHTSTYEGYHSSSSSTPRGWKNQMDSRAKFDLFRPFAKVLTWFPEGEWDPMIRNCRTKNLHMLDIFTVWDPTLDGIDNDGDGAVDEEDTGRQPGDKGGPEIRVFGRVDLNLTSKRVIRTLWPLNRKASTCYIASQLYGRNTTRAEEGYGNWGPWETIGDLLRADPITKRPGCWMAGGGSAWQNVTSYPDLRLGEQGMSNFSTYHRWNPSAKDPTEWNGDDDGDGIFDERDERDMIFTWLSNYLTTRSNVFEIDLSVDLCEAPAHPGVKIPLPVNKTRRSWARRKMLGILDRSTCLRIQPNGRCEFTGPVEVRMLRITEDKRVH